MTRSKGRPHLALPDIDPSIALAQARRHEVEQQLLAHGHTIDPLIEPTRNRSVVFIAALRQCFAALLKSTFRTSAGQAASVRPDV
jgi:hypothetical protein